MGKIIQSYMKMAIEQAKLAKSSGAWPFGAVITNNGVVVGKGKCEDQITHDVTAHAEVLALRDACHTLRKINLSDCIIYCTNEPCPMCAAAIFQAKIPKVIIGISRDDLSHLIRTRTITIDELARDSGYSITIERGFMKAEILQLFSDIRK